MKLDKETFKIDYCKKLMFAFCEHLNHATLNQKYLALGYLIRDYMSNQWHDTLTLYSTNKDKQVYYFSLEFLIGKLMEANLINLGIIDICREGLAELGEDFELLKEIEPDAGLGNGGLGRLAACFIDSMASLAIPGHGIGIRYKYGLFEQKIVNGYQLESPDNWLKINNVWEVRRDDEACIVKFGGHANIIEENGTMKAIHTDYEPILAVPYDMPVPGYENDTINTLRLWSAETDGNGFDFTSFSKGDFEKAAEGQLSVAAITSILYPDDSTERGKMLRLKQEYFFTSAGVQNIIKNVKKMGVSLYELDKYVAIHINDTHPAIAVAELMRILLDDESMQWDIAWDITVKTLAYTNHTILSEALEKWKVDMFKTLLPRIYMIIEEINRRFTSQVLDKYNGDFHKLDEMSIIQDNTVKMAFLAIVGSHSVNGVAELHTNILKSQELSNFHQFFSNKFNNKTNGITHRRWLIKANPALATLIDETIGNSWRKQPNDLSLLKAYLKDYDFVNKVGQVKYQNKVTLASYIEKYYHISIDCNSIFDIQVKRLHMYKRQLLNILHVMNLYNRLIDNPLLDIVPRTFIFGAKAFPGYLLAKNTIKLINTVANKINSDNTINNKIKVVFMENYGVTLAEKMIPAGDVSEQISTASKEASGTGNMKFMMNGAITIATMDGANVEIHREVGDDNIVVFGMSSQEVIDLYKLGVYRAVDVINGDPRLLRIISQLREGYFGLVDSLEFNPIVTHLIENNDPYYTLKDFDSYISAQDKIDQLYKDRYRWNTMAATNIACSGVFSSDNTVNQYANDIWGL